MGKILVSGVVNVENNLKVDSFPIEYTPVNFSFFGINTNIAGVGFNLSKALKTLGDEVELLSITGDDLNSDAIFATLNKMDISTDYIEKIAANTAQSIILYDSSGRRQIFTDIKNIQELEYPIGKFDEAFIGCDIAILCNVNYSRKLIEKVKRSGKLLACDVQAISDIEDEYNRDFIKNADILFFSNDKLGGNAEKFLKQIVEKFENKIIVAGLGGEGTLMYVRGDNFTGRFPAYNLNPWS